MRNFRATKGPFAERPFYKDEEIERTCAEELRAVNLYPTDPSPVRIDRFIEKRFHISHEYEDLAAGLLGYTEFGSAGVKRIVVARSLEEEGGKANERRVRSTLAHEAGHGLFHTHLFLLGVGHSELFSSGMAKPKVLCRNHGEGGERSGYKGEWWELHANRAIGGLLLPRRLVLRAIDQFLDNVGTLGLRSLRADTRREAADHVAEIFDVNRVVAVIRLDTLFPSREDVQQVL